MNFNNILNNPDNDLKKYESNVYNFFYKFIAEKIQNQTEFKQELKIMIFNLLDYIKDSNLEKNKNFTQTFGQPISIIGLVSTETKRKLAAYMWRALNNTSYFTNEEYDSNQTYNINLNLLIDEKNEKIKQLKILKKLIKQGKSQDIDGGNKLKNYIRNQIPAIEALNFISNEEHKNKITFFLDAQRTISHCLTVGYSEYTNAKNQALTTKPKVLNK